MKAENVDSTLKLKLITQSSKFLSLFYDLNDTIETCVNANDFSTLWYWKAIHEGNYVFRGKVTIDPDSGIAHYPDGRVFETPIRPRDPLGFLYYLRTINLETEQRFRIPYHFDRVSSVLKVEVAGIDTVYVPAFQEKRECFLVILRQKGKNIFRGKGDVYLWIDTHDKTIVKLSYTSKFGRMTALLVKKEGNFRALE